MSIDLSNCLVVGVSSRTLFDLKKENAIFEEKGLLAYSQYQREHEDEILQPGSGFHLVKGLLNLNNHFTDRRVVEVIVMSRNSADTGLRLFKSIQVHDLDIT
ncbi:MAG: 5'-nucleotidase, partial [Anaerolineae bacterium]|nr:5'-nucleotidase [Anaerolineae bacterium]